MFVNSDFSDLLRLFNDNGVRYLVTGGYAFILFAEPRYTRNLDLWIGTDTRNAAAVYRALKKFGAPLTDLTEDDFAEAGYFYQMGFHRFGSTSSWAYREWSLRRRGTDGLRPILMIFPYLSFQKKI